MPFVRVRSAGPGDPPHEFDVPAREVEKHPDLYKVIDPKPVATSRPASFVPGRVPVKSNRPAPKRARKKKSVESTPAPGAAYSQEEH